MEQSILGFGAERFPLPASAPQETRDKRSRAMLARALNLKTVVAFVGSGCSAPLGYPTWRGLVTRMVKHTQRILGPTERLRDIQERLRRERSLASRDLIFYLGLCQSLLESRGLDMHDIIAEFIAQADSMARGTTNPVNPYHALLQLPIERFVTTNYDHELEFALTDAYHCAPVSFTQKKKYYGQLAGFSMAHIATMRHGVFHCHGRFDEKDTIVASESDYQHWYLGGTDSGAVAFRQSLDLLFSSNPILFVGFGMEDDDLLRPLRMLSAITPDQKESRPLFALMPTAGKPRDRDRIESLYDRYGVHVISFDWSEEETVPQRGQRLIDALTRLREEWHEHVNDWMRKPPIRRVEMPITPPKTYRHYTVTTDDSDIIAPRQTTKDVTQLLALIKQKNAPRVLVITGEGGCGKSWRVTKVLDLLQNPRKRGFGGGVFFWSSYYTDDWLTGLERVLLYLDPRPARPRDRRLDRFAAALKRRRHVLVFDGFERLLRETSDPHYGRPYNHSVEQLLAVMAGAHKSTIILTSRLMPEPLKFKNADVVREFAVHRLTTADLNDGSVFAPLKPARNDKPATKQKKLDDLSALCSLCGGHAYALLLASKYLTADPNVASKRLAELRWRLSQKPPDSRNALMIGTALDAVDGKLDAIHGRKHLASSLLDRLAVFMSPVDEATMSVCFEAAEIQETARADVRRELLDAKLLLRVMTDPPSTAGGAMVTVHPTVRSFVFEKHHGTSNSGLPNFTLAGFTSGNAPVDPGTRDSWKITDLFDRLCVHVTASKGTPERQRSMCRAAFGVLRSRMEANTVSRWTNYPDHIRRGVRLLYLVKSIDPDRGWDYFEPTHAHKRQTPEGILYADELAWLYNDIGLALCSEGYMSDAYALWEQGYEIDRVTDSEEDGGQYIVQSRLHMAHLFLELGKLREAEEYMTRTEQANARYDDPDFRGRIQGYRGLLAHLAGNFDEAEVRYRTALKMATTKHRHNVRAESIFTRYLADLLMAKQRLPEAEAMARKALTLAREGNFPDLEAYARKSLAHAWREQKDWTRAQDEYNAALRMARKFGIRRLQADLYSELARLALSVGDWETARRRAIDSLMLANELNLGLRRTHGLVVLGLATLQSGDSELAARYFQHAFDLASEQGYHFRGREAEGELQRLMTEQQPAKDHAQRHGNAEAAAPIA